MTKHIANNNGTLLEALALAFPESSRTTLRSWIQEHRVEVDGQLAAAASAQVTSGQEIKLLSRSSFVDHNERQLPIPVIYADNDLIVIDKPAGLLTVSTAFETRQTAFARLKQKYYPKTVYVVHRLDQDTSGVMLFALSKSAYDSLKKLFAAHDLTRKYTAIVEGTVTTKKGTWQSYLYEDAQYVMHATDNPAQGERAVTHYKTIRSGKRFSHLELTLETGKKNQIRVHCQDAGHAIVGDKKYGAKSSPIKRLALHAHELSFMHPITGKMMTFKSELPAAMRDMKI